MSCKEIRSFVRWVVLPLALWLACMRPIAATSATFVELESTSLGDGWFQYRVKMFPESFFQQQELFGGGTGSFTNRTETGPVANGWEFASTDLHSAFWGYTNVSVLQTLPCEQVFRARSSETGFRMDSQFYISYSLWPASWLHSPYFSMNIVGYVRLPCLVPCPAGESDGSPTNYLTSYEMFPDVQISGLSPFTISFDWETDCTVLIQASSNLTAWTNVAYAFGRSGTASWTSSVPMPAYGSSFRVGLVSLRRETNWVNP
jgi:hypothetical protein